MPRVPRDWIVRLAYQTRGQLALRSDRYTDSVFVLSHALRPCPEDHAPDGAWVLRAEVLPADHLPRLPLAVRPRYARHYEAHRLWLVAQALGRDVAHLRPWIDYDLQQLHDSVRSWSDGRIDPVAINNCNECNHGSTTGGMRHVR